MHYGVKQAYAMFMKNWSAAFQQTDSLRLPSMILDGGSICSAVSASVPVIGKAPVWGQAQLLQGP